uniref:TlpA family protein disulfide reductase n=1 Tax=Gelidibacter sp. TaxID=2018083 RepID=UPI00404A23F1
MKNISSSVLLFLLILNCKQEEKIDINYISKEFNKRIENVEKIQYDVRKQMTFSDGNISDNEGLAIIEKQPNDKIFGFSFYGIMNNTKSAIYRDGNGFLISNDKNEFKLVEVEQSFLGRYGAQMIYKDIFQLDDTYKSVEVLETENSYTITYKFEDDLENEITNNTKILELDKNTFLPKKVTISSVPDFGSKNTTVYVFDNVKTNETIDKQIDEYIQDLNQFELIIEEEPQPNALLNKQLPSLSLKNLFNDNETIQIKTDKVTLIDFWEVWCGPCIASFPKVENLKTKFSNNLNVVGIVSEDTEKAKNLVTKKGTTFLNLIGNKEIKEMFNVNSFPRYFLIDKNGIIQKEYYGFSDQIEKDIEALIK